MRNLLDAAALMAETFTDLDEAAPTPESDYGYWITADGDIHPVAKFRHEQVCGQYGLSYAAAFRAGWLRVVAYRGSFFVQTYNAETITVRALSALRRLALLGGYEDYTSDLTSPSTFNAAKQFDDPLRFINYVAGVRQKIAVARQTGERVVNEHFLGEAAVVPETPYGYWIDAQGQFIVVNGPTGHLSEIRKLDWWSYAEAFQAGWVRIVSQIKRGMKETLSINFDRGCVGARTASAVRQLLKSKTFDQFYVDVGPDEGAEFMTLEDETAFMRFFNQCRQPVRSEVNEAAIEIPPTEYGYWIKPDGEFIVVGHFDHIQTARREGGFYDYEDAFDAGWVRIVAAQDFFAVNSDSLLITTQALGSIRALLKERLYPEYQAEFGQQHKRFTDPKPMMRYIRQCRQQAAAQHAEQTMPLDEAALMEAVEVPRTTYGYWIKPDGEIVVVEPGQHLAVINFLSGDKWLDYKQPFAVGWIRVIAADGYCIAHFQRGKPSARAASSMRAIAGQGIFYAFEVEVIGAREDYKEFDDPRSFMNFITAARQPTSV